jgi:ribosomal protein S18 acetylase RimI-like enzyme
MSPATSQTVTPGSLPLPPDVVVRPLRPEDLEAVIALDSRSGGSTRRGYFEKRLAAGLRKPKAHYQLALTTGHGLVGFLLARVAGGEYGRPEDVVVLEALGVDPAKRHAGLGRQMLAGLAALASAHGIHRLVTQVDWRNHSMLKFLAGGGFELAPRQILERVVGRIPLPDTDEEIEKWPPRVRHLEAGDLAALVRIDGRITGQDRSRYLERKFDEALNESAIAMSLVAESDGHPVAFAMARVDFGDFGHVEPIAALDTIGVDPPFERHGFARAVLSQMIDNLAALHVRRLETEVARESFGLLGFLYDFGFGPSQRLSFQRTL